MATATIFRSVYKSPLGPMTLLMSERGACGVHYGCLPGPRGTVDSPRKTAPLARELDQYFAGKRRKFTIPLDLQGTHFQMDVWRALCKVPYGATASYADIARAVGRPQAFRAVGQANHRNPVAIIVPCHRIIGANGAMTGYGGPAGIHLKERLLTHEATQK